MSLASLMDSTCTVRRASISKDANEGTTQTFDIVVTADQPCSYQESSSSVADFYGQRQTVNSVTVFFYDDPLAVVNDQVVVTTTDNNGISTTIYLVADGVATPKANYRLWTLTCSRQKQP